VTPTTKTLPPTAECLPAVELDVHPLRALHVSFDGATCSSDGGLLLVRALDDKLQLSARLAVHFPDARDPDLTIHPRLEQIRQVLYQLVLGYEDRNDATTLRHDRLFLTVCDRLPNDPLGLSSQPTLSRFEHAPTARDLVRMQRMLEEYWVESLPADTSDVVLDLDSTSDPTYGEQPESYFHGHYKTNMYFPLLVFDGDGRIASVRLRPGNAGNNRYATPLLIRLIRSLKKRFPLVRVAVRADSGFCSPRLLCALEILNQELHDVDYVIGLEKNAVLNRLIENELRPIREEVARSRQPGRTYTTVRYRAKTWATERFVVGKLEALVGKDNPRFVVTTLEHVPARMLYENAYCGRGDSENRIKDFKRALRGERLSCTTYIANAVRLVLHGFAYALVDGLRREVGQVCASLAGVQMDTLRRDVLKVVAFVGQSFRRITVALTHSWPNCALFQNVLRRLGARERGLSPAIAA